MMFAVVRIRGRVNMRKDVKDTLKMLKLNRINNCILVSKNPNNEGMIRKVRDFVTWGEIDRKTLEKLISERGRLAGDKKIEGKALTGVLGKLKKGEALSKIKEIKPMFRLNPPKKGFRSIKHAHPKGALGYRGEKINELLERMI